MSFKKFALGFALVFLFINAAFADEVVRIGIMRFYNKAAGLTQSQAESITDIFTRMLANSSSIAIVERERLDAIGREQRFGMSGLVDSDTAAQIGRIAGCQYMLLGSITQFNKQSQETKFSFIRENKYNVSVTVDMRVVNVETTEVVLSLSETGNASHTASGVNLDNNFSTQEKYHEGLEGEAINNAVSKLGQRIREIIAGEYSQVLSIAGRDVTVNVGASSGAKKGGLYRVYADGPEVHDMKGRVIGHRDIDLAIIKISSVQNEFSTAQAVKDGGKVENIRRGDKIMPISPSDAKTLAKHLPKKRPTTGLKRNTELEGDELNAKLEDMADEQGVEIKLQDTGTASVAKPARAASTGGMAAPMGRGVAAPKRAFENKSTDPAKVIDTYGLPSGDANTRRIAHISAGRIRNKRDAYNKYVELANSYSGDYLAAYKAGETALSIGDRDNAKVWLDKALDINPSYEPAQKAKTRLLNSQPKAKSKSRRKK
ncbi:MAG: hypothetical protein IJG62_05965 [Synergistaceae bacterium]|nr:hypothetical protein [Synergistaceae bacterium]MBQ3626234.1 hypothetical protein [Synergistaceae bacterium]MBQ6909245.1 hypothetical protein [Synergistaceae bacterium]MBQ7569774.1 hypothetical protein [Synergistaceae bacterium]MBQ9581279.1 hypothetical protein [Synergistaceae bacterium]